MRAYLTGVDVDLDLDRLLARRARVLRAPLPDGLRKHEKLPEPLVTPTTKAQQGRARRAGLARRDRRAAAR